MDSRICATPAPRPSSLSTAGEAALPTGMRVGCLVVRVSLPITRGEQGKYTINIKGNNLLTPVWAPARMDKKSKESSYPLLLGPDGGAGTVSRPEDHLREPVWFAL